MHFFAKMLKVSIFKNFIFLYLTHMVFGAYKEIFIFFEKNDYFLAILGRSR